MSQDFTGRTLGRYRVVAPLGRGGMGDVYRARDESLGRDVAIKVLPPDLTADAARVERFVTEARAASALNHPHLTTVYEIGAEPVHYIAMELVQGRTIRAILDAGRPELRALLDWMLQIADALDAAHDAGVIHRDIKPENLMVTGDGYAKILDFGVAKLRADEAVPDDAATRVALTEAGTLLGTSGYMSPEQAQAKPTDRRTDIFSLGSVIYECVTGSKAFDAPSTIERLHRVISDEPAPIVRSAPNVPPALVSVIGKCLAKDPDARYASMRDLAVDLRDVRRRLDTTIAGAVAPVRPARRSRAIVAMVGVLVLAAIAGLAVFKRRAAEVAGEAAPTTAIDRITTSGNTVDATISPDGRSLAHVEAAGAVQSLWLRNLDSGEERQLVPPGNAYFGLRFSPDGRSLAFTTRGPGQAAGRLNILTLEGGTPRVLLTRILTPASFSPDGRRLSFLREQYPDQESSALIVVNADGTGERVLATRRAPDSFTPTFFTSTTWSPDGRQIATSARNLATQRSQLIAFDVESGAERPLYESARNITFTHWLPDASGIVYVERTFESYAGSAGQLWLKPSSTGAPRRITRDLLDYRTVSMTADARTLVSVGAEYQASLYTVPLDGSPPRRIPSSRYDGLEGVAPLPDGSIVTTTVVRRDPQIVRISPDGATRTVLTSAGSNTQPAVSPDGSTIAMVSNRDGALGVWRMARDGSEQRLLAHVPGAGWLSFTADGRDVICTSYRGIGPATWRVPVNGGQAVEINRQLDRATISPDGKWIAGIYETGGTGENSRPVAAVMPIDGSAPPRPIGPLIPATGTGILTWTKDGSGLIGSRSERFNLWAYDLAGGEPKQLTNLSDVTFVRGSLAIDGRAIVASRGLFIRDAFAIRDFK